MTRRCDSATTYSPHPSRVLVILSETDATTQAIAAATGIGGVGKTQLASEFVHRYGYYGATARKVKMKGKSGAAISTRPSRLICSV